MSKNEILSEILCKNCQHPEKDHFSCEIGSFCKSCPTENHIWEHTFQPHPEKRGEVKHTGTCFARSYNKYPCTCGAIPPASKSTHLSNGGNEFCPKCGAGIGKFRREGEGTCPSCDPTINDWAEKEAKEWLLKTFGLWADAKGAVSSLATLLRRVAKEKHECELCASEAENIFNAGREVGNAAIYEHAVQICEYQQMFYDERSDAQGYHALKIAIEKIRAAAIAGKGKP